MANYIYFIRCGAYCKIGVADNISRRLSQLQTGNPIKLDVITVYQLDDAEYVEKLLHGDYNGNRELGEWFLLSDIDIVKAKSRCILLGGQLIEEYGNREGSRSQRSREKRKEKEHCYRVEHPEEIREREKIYRAANRNIVKSKNKRWRDTHLEKAREAVRRCQARKKKKPT